SQYFLDFAQASLRYVDIGARGQMGSVLFDDAKSPEEDGAVLRGLIHLHPGHLGDRVGKNVGIGLRCHLSLHLNIPSVSWTGLPPTNVASTRVAGMSSSGMVMMSSDNTTRSAN